MGLSRKILMPCVLLLFATLCLVNSKRRLPDGQDSSVIWDYMDINIMQQLFDDMNVSDIGIHNKSHRETLSSSCEDHRVTNLPGLDPNEPLTHYAGHISVDAKSRGEFFYWLFESKIDPLNAPLIIWLNRESCIHN